MYHLTLTPKATVGLFLAHRAYDAKGSPQIRASVDAERLFLPGDETGLLKPVDDGQVQTVATEKIDIVLENHIFEHFQRSMQSAAEGGGVFGYNGTREKPRANPQFYTEAEDAMKSAEKKDAPTKPTLVEKTLPDEEKKKKKA